MAVKNEFIQNDGADKPTASSRKKEKVVASDSTSKKSLFKFGERIDKKRVRTILGIAFVLFSFFSFLACFSYFFTWQADQDRVLDTNLFSFLFDGNPEPVANWFGKFGAWMSHLYFYRWFGISSFAIIFMIFLIGFKWMLSIHLLPIARSFSISFLFMIWSSIFLGYFVDKVDYLGGTFGFMINQWMLLSIGSIGGFVVILALLWVNLIVLFNVDFGSFLGKFKSGSNMFEESDEDETLNAFHPADIHVVNTIKDDQIQKEAEANEILFDEDEEESLLELDDDEEDSFVVIHKGAERAGDEELEMEISEAIENVQGSTRYRIRCNNSRNR
jgi:S-DNA-T family DNA segregation ATPase FtsK/SpoIIIE